MNTNQRRAARHAGRSRKERARSILKAILVDAAALGWNALRAYAASKGVPTHRRRRADIEADLNEL